MKIQSVQVENFRLLESVQVDFDDVTTFIGPNGVGKSSILRALGWFFGEDSLFDPTTDRSFGDNGSNTSVSVTFRDLTQSDCSSLGPLAPSDPAELLIRKTCTPEGTSTTYIRIKSYPAFDRIRNATTADDKKRLYSEIITEDPSLGLSPLASAKAITAEIVKWEKNNPDRLKWSYVAAPPNFMKRDATKAESETKSGKKASDAPHCPFGFVYIAADLRASEQTSDGKATVINDIIDHAVERKAAAEEVQKLIKKFSSKERKIYKKIFKSPLKGASDQINQLIDGYSSGRKVALRPPKPTVKTGPATFEVEVFDHDLKTTVGRQGHGFQRTILIAALQFLAQSRAASSPHAICLAIEEPELYQHPTQARALAQTLRALAENQEKRFQVTYVTHSPYFVEPLHFNQIRRVTRPHASCGVTISSATPSALEEALKGAIEGDRLKRQLDGLVANKLSEALFADRVLLVEGTTEAAVFQGIGDRLGPAYLESHGVALVVNGGKESIPIAHAVLAALKIPVYSLFDYDANLQERMSKRGRSTKDMTSSVENNQLINQMIFGYFDQPVPPQVTDALFSEFAVFQDCLETLLKTEWDGWAEACSESDIADGLVDKNAYAYRQACLASEAPPPPFLENIVKKVISLNGSADHAASAQ